MKIQTWVLASRPKTLWCSISPVVVGTLMAWSDGGFHMQAAVGCLLMGLAVQIATNFHNDYCDFEKGTDNEERLGPVRVTQAGFATPSEMAFATLAIFFFALLCSLWLSVRAGWPIVAVAAASIASGWAYTGGPRPFAYNGLADLFVLLFFGPVATGGTYYCQTLSLNPGVLLCGLAPGLICAAVLTVNNLRDIEGDSRSGKRTLAVRFGKGFARMEYLVCFVLASFVPVIAAGYYGYGSAMFGWILLPLAWPNVRTVWTCQDAARLNPVLAGTGKLLMAYTALFGLGFVV